MFNEYPQSSTVNSHIPCSSQKLLTVTFNAFFASGILIITLIPDRLTMNTGIIQVSSLIVGA